MPSEGERGAVGLFPGHLDQLDRVAARLESPWTFLATAERSSNCNRIWREAERSLPDPPRFVFTGEKLLDPNVGHFLPIDHDRFAWEELGPEDWADRESQFEEKLARRPRLSGLPFRGGGGSR
jgi:hypothetical protein